MPQDTRHSIISTLRDAGISPSEPRIAVFSYLLKHKNHPNVETIFRSLLDEYPTLSRTTVYNTLRLLAAHQLINALNIQDGELRYDADTQFHAHFKCRKCGKVIDIFNVRKPDFPDLSDAKIESVQTNFYGICTDCDK